MGRAWHGKQIVPEGCIPTVGKGKRLGKAEGAKARKFRSRLKGKVHFGPKKGEKAISQGGRPTNRGNEGAESPIQKEGSCGRHRWERDFYNEKSKMRKKERGERDQTNLHVKKLLIFDPRS